MSNNSLLEERQKMIKSCIRMEKIPRVINVSNFYTWKFHDSGYPIREIMTNNELIGKVMQEFHDRYQFDVYVDFGFRNQIEVLDILGNTCTNINLDTGAINHREQTLMGADEYKDYIKDKPAMQWKMMKRKYPNLSKQDFAAAIASVNRFGEESTKITNDFIERNGTPRILDNNMVLVPIEDFYAYYRGVKELTMDMRRNKESLKEACDFDFEHETLPRLVASLGNSNPTVVGDYYIPLLAHSFMNVKQFGEFYWPHLKMILDIIVNAGKTAYFFTESTIMRFNDSYKDYPAKHLIFQLEQDDVVEFRKEVPNAAIVGGMKSLLLGYGSKEECVDYAKYLLDSMGNGFLFGQDKMVSFHGDCKRENLLAVNEVVRNYRP